MKAVWRAWSAAAVVAAGIWLLPSAVDAQAPRRDGQLDVQEMLVKNAITAVNHGNLTGNYTVLRDLGAPSFRERNSAAQLATIFQKLRDQKFDLSPILVLQPVYTQRPGIDQAGELLLVGYFPTQPMQIQFRLAFQHVGGGWMIDTVSISTAPAPQQMSQMRQPMPPAPGAPVYYGVQQAGYTR
jgi:hypothetical protein